MASIADAERVQKLVRERFGRLPGVRGVGVTWNDRGDAHVRVNVESGLREKFSSLIPSEVNGVAIELRSVRAMRTFAGDR